MMKLFQPKEQNSMTFDRLAPGDVFQLSDESIWKLVKMDGEKVGIVFLADKTGSRQWDTIEFKNLPYDNMPVYNVNKFYLIYQDDLPK